MQAGAGKKSTQIPRNRRNIPISANDGILTVAQEYIDRNSTIMMSDMELELLLPLRAPLEARVMTVAHAMFQTIIAHAFLVNCISHLAAHLRNPGVHRYEGRVRCRRPMLRDAQTHKVTICSGQVGCSYTPQGTHKYPFCHPRKVVKLANRRAPAAFAQLAP